MERAALKRVMIVLAVCLLVTSALGDSIVPPTTYKQPTADGRYVFVMISPRLVEYDRGGEIRATYSRSGLYPNDGSTVPLWTVDWYAYQVDVASDGVHMVRHGPWTSSSDQEALSFFARGQLVRTYRVKDVLDFPILMPHSVSHFDWIDGQHFDDAKLQYELRTKEGGSFVFDVTTGRAVRTSRPARVVFWGVVAVAGYVLAARYVRRRQRRGAPEGPLDTPWSRRALVLLVRGLLLAVTGWSAIVLLRLYGGRPMMPPVPFMNTWTRAFCKALVIFVIAGLGFAFTFVRRADPPGPPPSDIA